MNLKERIIQSQQRAKEGIFDETSDLLLAYECAKLQFAQEIKLHAGKIAYVWRTAQGILCAQYTSTLRWQYTWDEDNDCLAWR